MTMNGSGPLDLHNPSETAYILLCSLSPNLQRETENLSFLSPLMELSHVRWPGRPTPRYWRSTLCVYYRRVEEHDLIDS